MALEDAGVDRVGDVARGVEGELDDRARASEAEDVNVGAVGRVYEDRDLPPGQFGHYWFEDRIAQVVPRHVGGQDYAVESQFVQGVGEFGQCLVGAVRREGGKRAEPVRVFTDQLSAALVDHSGDAGAEFRVLR